MISHYCLILRLREGFGVAKANVSTEEVATPTKARLPGTDEQPGWSSGPTTPPSRWARSVDTSLRYVIVTLPASPCSNSSVSSQTRIFDVSANRDVHGRRRFSYCTRGATALTGHAWESRSVNAWVRRQCVTESSGEYERQFGNVRRAWLQDGTCSSWLVRRQLRRHTRKSLGRSRISSRGADLSQARRPTVKSQPAGHRLEDRR